jgi:hypothetical protein
MRVMVKMVVMAMGAHCCFIPYETARCLSTLAETKNLMRFIHQANSSP